MEANIIKVPIGSVTSKERAMSFGEHLHMDIFGPLPVKAIGGYSYVLTIVDDYSRWAYMIEIKNKSDALEKYHVFTNQLKNQFNIIVKILQSDNDAVFLGKEFEKILNDNGTIRHLTVHDTPEQNGVAERMHRTIMNIVRVSLLQYNMPQRLWLEAIKYCYKPRHICGTPILFST